MTFSDLTVGDHFLWPTQEVLVKGSANVNIKIAQSDDGGGAAIDLVTREDCKCPFAGITGDDPIEIPAHAPVIKLDGHW